MYQVGECVVYGPNGVCRIADTLVQTVNGNKTDFFVLEAVDRSGLRFFVPTNSPAALSKIRPVLKKEELIALLRSEKLHENCWENDEKNRKQLYRQLISGDDREALLQMIFSVYAHKQEVESLGRRLHLCDETFLRDAEKMINTEFSLVLGVSPDEVVEYILAEFHR